MSNLYLYYQNLCRFKSNEIPITRCKHKTFGYVIKVIIMKGVDIVDKLIRHIAEILDNQKRWVNIGGWGSISLPSGKQLNYNFNNGCYIEVAGIGSRVFPTINI